MSLGADKKFSITLSPFWPLAENWLTGSDKSEGCKWHLLMFSWPSGGHCPLHVREPLLFQPLCKAPSSAWAVSLRYQSRDDQQTVIIICKKKKTQKPRRLRFTEDGYFFMVLSTLCLVGAISLGTVLPSPGTVLYLPSVSAQRPSLHFMGKTTWLRYCRGEPTVEIGLLRQVEQLAVMKVMPGP